MTPFVHLHVHSAFSFARGADSVERLCDAARERGMDALAVTDRNGLYGLVWVLQFARAAGVRPIVGAEAAWGAHRAVVLVRTAEGYAGLCRLLTRLHAAMGPTVGSEGDIPLFPSIPSASRPLRRLPTGAERRRSSPKRTAC